MHESLQWRHFLWSRHLIGPHLFVTLTINKHLILHIKIAKNIFCIFTQKNRNFTIKTHYLQSPTGFLGLAFHRAFAVAVSEEEICIR